MGPRPIDIHLSSLKQLGCTIDNVSNGEITVKTTTSRCAYLGNHRCCLGSQINLSFPSVGATQNIILAAVCADGITIINNAAKEPEIIDLQMFLNKAGYVVLGAGSSTIKIIGRNIIKTDISYKIMVDRIVAGTLLFATAMNGGNVSLKGLNIEHLNPLISTLSEMGCSFVYDKDIIEIVSKKRLVAPSIIRTLPYPGYPTDMQAISVAALTIATGTSIVVENIFESRFRYIDELAKMGANIKVENKIAVVTGVDNLVGANVNACDLRAGAALVLAGTVAQGMTTISDVAYIDRGYYKIEEMLGNLGADIVRVKG